jgi:hypothetical protein
VFWALASPSQLTTSQKPHCITSKHPKSRSISIPKHLSTMMSSLDQWDPNVEDITFKSFSQNSGSTSSSGAQAHFEQNVAAAAAAALSLEPLSLPSMATQATLSLSLPALRTPATSSSAQQSPTPNAAIGSNSLLHRACQQFATDSFVIKTALALDASAIRRSAFITANCRKCSGDANTRFVALPQRRKQPRKEAFQLPINIALNNDANFEVLALLVCAAPDVLMMGDSSNGMCSLSLALTKRPRDTQVMNLLLTANPQASWVADRRQNLPLHVACQKGAPLEVVRQLFFLYPSALRKENFHGETPLMIAQRNSKCPEDVLNFLQCQ